jgi:hypothetical protein
MAMIGQSLGSLAAAALAPSGAALPLASAVVGAVCAAAGVYAVAPVPERAEMDRALLRTAVAMAAACAWALWWDEVLATLLPFIATTFLLGRLRVRALEHPPAPAAADPATGSGPPARPAAPAALAMPAVPFIMAAGPAASPAPVAEPQPSSSPSSASPSRGSSR